jgi:hypothetical protein
MVLVVVALVTGTVVILVPEVAVPVTIAVGVAALMKDLFSLHGNGDE